MPGNDRHNMSLEPLPAEATGVPAPVSVADALRDRCINLNLQAADRDGLLHELVSLVIPPREKRLAEKLFKALKERENLCSTCVNEGVAIPHARNALVGLVDEPIIAYGRHKAGVEFGALDGNPVHHFFLLCAPSVRQHLPLLARLARILNNPDVRARLNAVGSAPELINLIRDAEAFIC